MPALDLPNHLAQAVKNHAEGFPKTDDRERESMRMAQFPNIGCHEFEFISRAVGE